MMTQKEQSSRQIYRRLAATLLAFAAILPPLAASAESDLDAYMRGKMFRVWVNDDADDSQASPTPTTTTRLAKTS